ncbi:hypothetical protein G6F65_019258 [Rhizopus arrhizus]|nr:hypothetical protein G6F65_019258 [Rhizopus arrhizus]
MGRQRQADADGAQYAPVPEARPRAAAAEDRRMEFPKVVADRPVRAAAGLGDLAVVRRAQAPRTPDGLWTWRP